MNYSKEQINELLVTYLMGEAGEDEINIVKQLIRSNKEIKSHYLALKKSWMFSVRGSNPYQFDASKGYAAFTQRQHPKKKRILPGFFRYAAVFVVAFFLGLAVHLMFSENGTKKPVSAVMNETEVPFGVRSKVYLSDGTMVWLNAGSKLTYPSVFDGKERKVLLEGEAYFEVKTNPELPFVVDVSGILVKAYGTRFNIKAYGDEPYIETLLVEGKVTVQRINELKEVIHLKPNEMITIHRNALAVQLNNQRKEVLPLLKKISVITSEVSSKEVTSWKDPRWIIANEKLGSLAKTLERLYNIEVIFMDPTLSEFRYSGTLLDEPLDQLLEVIRLTSPLNYTIEANRVVFTRNKEFEIKYKDYYYNK